MNGTLWGDIDFNTLVNNIPGAVICCDTSEDLNLIQYSEGFLKLVGYSREELETKFKNRFSPLIWEGDLEETYRTLHRQLAKGNTKELEYRVVCRDGSLRWILDRGALLKREDGEYVYCCILMDIGENKKSREELRLSLERHEIIMSQSEDVIFEWNLESDTLTFSAKLEKKFGYKPRREKISGMDVTERYVMPEDWPIFEQLRRNISSGKSYSEAECRLKKADGSYIWCNIRITLLSGGEGLPSKAIGVLIDVDNEKKETLRLKEKAERDALTGLYNKGTAESIARHIVNDTEDGGKCAFLLFDLDNFKTVNDLYGHLSGDALLGDVAKILQKSFRKGDMIGRTGGDEFFVVMKDIEKREDVEQRAKDVLAELRTLVDEHREKFQISGSVGISIFPMDGREMRTLYNNADIALHHAKAAGKNDFCFYSPSMMCFGQAEEEAEPALGQKRENSGGTGIESQANGFIEYVFHTLYNSKNLEKDILLILEIIGRRFDVSRAYIFEDSDDDSSSANTFEWCNEGIVPQQQELQNVSYGDLGNYRGNFNDDGVFYCKDVSQLSDAQRQLLEGQGIKSVLQCLIRDEGVVRGFIGFDECRSNRFWTQRQVESLSMIADMVGTFLLKSRARKKVLQLAKSLAIVLDHQDAWIYIVEKDTFNVLYANQKTRELVPSVQIGKPCHLMFFSHEEPCEDCPILKLKEGAQHTEEHVYSAILGQDVSVKVNVQPWIEGKESFLVTCRWLGRPERGPA